MTPSSPNLINSKLPHGKEEAFQNDPMHEIFVKMQKWRHNTSPSFPVANTCTHASSIHSSVCRVPAFNWIQWCAGWIKLSLWLNGMLPMGGELGGSLCAWAEKSSALRASAAEVRAPAAFRGERDTGGLDWRENKTQSCQIKTSQIGRWQIPSQSCWTHLVET